MGPAKSTLDRGTPIRPMLTRLHAAQRGMLTVARTSAIIELLPLRVTLHAVDRGRIIATRSEDLGSTGGAEAQQSLADVALVLQRLAGELSLTGARATLIYQRPETALVVTSSPDASEAGELSAKLALAEAAGYPLDDNPYDTVRLSRMRSTRAGDAVPDENQFLFASASESESFAAALAGLITSAGMKVSSFIPAQIVALLDAAKACQGHIGGAGVALHVSDHLTALVAGSNGRIAVARVISTGLEDFIWAMARSVTLPNGAPHSISKTQAALIFSQHGFPVRGQPTGIIEGLSGDLVMPLVAPVLQRAAIEIKQSLRFAIAEKDRSQTSVLTRGSGAAVRGLINAVAVQAGLPPCDPPLDPSTEPVAIVAGTSLAQAWLDLGEPPFTTIPKSERLAGAHRMARRAITIGAAVACLAVGYEAVWSRVELRGLTQQHDLARAALAGAGSTASVAKDSVRIQGELAGVHSRIDQWVGPIVAWNAMFESIGKQTDPRIALNEIDVSTTGDLPVVRLRGTVRAQGDAEGATVVQHYLAALGSLPIVESSKLNSTRRTGPSNATAGNAPASGGDSGQEFDLSLVLVALPPSVFDYVARASKQRGSPVATAGEVRPLSVRSSSPERPQRNETTAVETGGER